MKLAPTLRLGLGLIGLLGFGAVASADDDHHPVVIEAKPGADFGECVMVPMPETPIFGGTPISKIIFLNRCVGGCQIIAGQGNDARENKSGIPEVDSVVSEFRHGDGVWNEVLECVREIFAPFDVMVTDEDPSPMFHHEAIVAGTPQELGLGGDIGGIAPGGCQAQNNVISFTFANFYAGRARTICEVVGQESAHAFGLDHALDCLDPMTYLQDCGLKYFRDKNTPCGEYVERTCSCGGSSQNSHRKLLSVFGPGAETPAPDISILLPRAGTTVQRGFSVYVEATARRGIGAVDLWVNGTKVASKAPQTNNDTYVFVTSDYSLPDSIIDVEIRASDDLGSVGTRIVTVTQGGPCNGPEGCLDGQGCNDGRCTYPPPIGEVGDPCVRKTDCLSDLCQKTGTEKRCSEFCVPGIADQCINAAGDLECLPAGDRGICWPIEGSTEGGCCSVGSDNDLPAGQILLFLAVMWLCVRRRGASVRD